MSWNLKRKDFKPRKGNGFVFDLFSFEINEMICKKVKQKHCTSPICLIGKFLSSKSSWCTVSNIKCAFRLLTYYTFVLSYCESLEI
jgi:hypothetical protein